MSVHLHRLEFERRGPQGWTTGELAFGKFLTILHAANGAGKTPVLKGIVYALGYPTELPPSIRQHCKAVSLELKSGKNLKITREISDSFHITVKEEASSKTTTFKNEAQFSEWLLELFAIPPRRFTDKNDRATTLYTSTLLPCIWIDQDSGWLTTYSPLKSKDFIPDQGEEMLRVLLGLPPRRAFIDKEEVIKLKRELAALDDRLSAKRLALELHQAELSRDTGSNIATLESQREQIISTLKQNESGIEAMRTSGARFDPLIESQAKVCNTLQRSIITLEGQKQRINRIVGELDSETELLALSETAAEAFREFCGKEGCQMFRSQHTSYGRRLLYLKDQIKDLKTATDFTDAELVRLREQWTTENNQLKTLQTEKEKSLADSGYSTLLSSVEALTRQLTEIELKSSRLSHLEADRGALEALINQREQLLSQLAESQAGSRRPAFSRTPDAQRYLQLNMEKWLRILNTQNLDSPPAISEHFELYFGETKFNAHSWQSGSTRTRIVLAYHAAVFETSVEIGGNHPGFLILDAPKQHELAEEDFNAYTTELRNLCRKSSFQLIFAVSDMSFSTQPGDVVWRPAFGTREQPRYFGLR